ncbi:hypothetical protein SAMD00019534_091010 [Acytostelium subglobosum LB1]|uniref:hypothetical protein n=1 Tax=Acytostelium subglobosum LB1 TaxID=1410327 RepID=UPI000644C184|nr:hypothetical protein SAMD00019534_091010 [Acytostelium subglobosum LB1]GAM25926.1 hypothetical protein SAMD00019534_091010 [Acytostelium subglobosum LB1]|eukprot:XP_012750969.1 hypothetical protein SAMD00019534_091010 [Acytostelium subglobosum LB1]
MYAILDNITELFTLQSLFVIDLNTNTLINQTILENNGNYTYQYLEISYNPVNHVLNCLAIDLSTNLTFVGHLTMDGEIVAYDTLNWTAIGAGVSYGLMNAAYYPPGNIFIVALPNMNTTGYYTQTLRLYDVSKGLLINTVQTNDYYSNFDYTSYYGCMIASDGGEFVLLDITSGVSKPLPINNMPNIDTSMATQAVGENTLYYSMQGDNDNVYLCTIEFTAGPLVASCLSSHTNYAGLLHGQMIVSPF